MSRADLEAQVKNILEDVFREGYDKDGDSSTDLSSYVER